MITPDDINSLFSEKKAADDEEIEDDEEEEEDNQLAGNYTTLHAELEGGGQNCFTSKFTLNYPKSQSLQHPPLR